MPLFARVFVTVLDSSIAEDYTLRHVFEDLFKLCDWKTGVVDMTRQAISRRLNIPIEIINDCIGKLEGPDPASRDPDNDGRRIRRLDAHRDWGWQILNWQKYDAIRNRADVALRVQRHREKEKSSNGLAQPAMRQGEGAGKESTPPVQPPLARVRASNRPGSVEEVIEAGKMLGVGEALCRKFWNKYETTARHDENDRAIWMTGKTSEQQVGNWRNLLAAWKATEDENRGSDYKPQRAPKEHHKEPGPAPVLRVQTFSQPAQENQPNP